MAQDKYARIELTNNNPLIQFANHYTPLGAREVYIYIYIYTYIYIYIYICI